MKILEWAQSAGKAAGSLKNKGQYRRAFYQPFARFFDLP